MRIAVVGFALTGILAVILQLRVRQRNDSVEYHVRGYRETERKVNAPKTFLSDVRDTWRRSRRKKHRSELVRLGYLESRTFPVTNGLTANFAAAVQKVLISKGTNYDFATVAISPTNTVKVTTVKGMMPTEEEIMEEMKSALPTEQ